MKVHPQIIAKNGQPAFVVLPVEEYEQLLKLLENIKDIEAIALVNKDKNERFPLELVESIARGENPIKLFREYRGLSQVDLAKKIGVTRQYISQLESGERKGTTKLLKVIAKMLNVELNDIT